ncbi:MAG: hypothetical protein HY291_22145 [Planctomycetes bacterium]|nr:hypothetical protein [Planctomycetota bacterium]
MPDHPNDQELAKWQRWFAVECNNAAWDLAEKPERSTEENAAMLQVAHAAAYHWSKAGNALNQVRARLLLAQVHALLGDGPRALEYARSSHADLAQPQSPEWERALAHAVLAHAAKVAGQEALYREHYPVAKRLGEGLPEDDKAMFMKTFGQIPAI